MRLSLALLTLALLCSLTQAQPILHSPSDPPPVPLDARPVQPVPAVGMPSVQPALTLDAFARGFKALPSRAKYEVVLIHPCTGQPVKVCFDLPGCPRRIKCHKTELVFRYGLLKKPVVVTFCRDGGVKVH